MRLLASYRHQLAEEAAGRSHRFADILKYFRRVWYATIALAGAFLMWGMWVALSLEPNSTEGMALIIFPFGALLLIVGGAVPYKLAQLFLSVDPHKGQNNG